MKKILSIILTAAIVLSLAACSQNDMSEAKNGITMAADATGAAMSTAPSGIEGETFDGAAGAESLVCDEAWTGGSESSGTGSSENGVQPQAGTLTAGVWNDNDHWSFWNDLYQYKSEWESYRTMWGKANLKRYFVTVANGTTPLENISVKLVDSQYNTIWEAKTDNSGKCYLFADATANSAVKITADVGTQDNGATTDVTHELSLVDGTNAYSFKLSDGKNAQKGLDVMFMVDTTGSMGDELDYLKTELESIINRVASENSNVSPIRVSVNFYRDDEDEYVVRAFDFTTDIKQALSDLRAQSYDGGGDFPEAVDQALDSAINSHSWNNDSTKIMFLVLDAPSHDTEEINAKINKYTAEAAANGIRIVPVASSGIDKATEYELRDLAFKTGGQYVFLTDDSGVSSGQHITPTIGDYTVEKLNNLIVKLVGSYLEAKPVAQYTDEKVEIKVVPEGEIRADYASVKEEQGSYILHLSLTNTTSETYHGTYLPAVLRRYDAVSGDWVELSAKSDTENSETVSLAPGSTSDYTLNISENYLDVAAGEYEFEACYTCDAADDTRTMNVMFNISASPITADGKITTGNYSTKSTESGLVLSFTIKNETSEEYGFGYAPYRLEKEGADGEWTEIDLNPEYAWTEQWAILSAGAESSYDINLTSAYGELSSGNYRYSVEISDNYAEKVIAIAKFTV